MRRVEEGERFGRGKRRREKQVCREFIRVEKREAPPERSEVKKTGKERKEV